ncbi:sensor histidine kinase [Polymorphobacter multimanifer]|uniref:histidine kinase n=1 Tax=Polymorphobacter multimanifer TaxID=1070431 RepID=A0A841L5C8_9SPHN|nr:sensor histidine kinase [Polymorphobacter multimanifer]MBB6228099.1 two-component sensor histidine kinase [Polymorphobacter multimanifer]GGI70109.1 sensor histidine kinase [Polymorphobacter multimanifer]
MKDAHDQTNVEQLLATPGLADALESEQFKQFLDHVPVAIAVSEIQRAEAITYCNLEFERLTGRTAADIQGHDWTVLSGEALAPGEKASLSEAVMSEDEYIGTFKIANGETICDVDAWSNIIENDHGTPLFRLVALATTGQRIRAAGEQDEQLLRDKDVLLRELQHRVKNNLQMITALIRMEARNLPEGETGERFTRLAGRINSLALLYDLLAGETMTDGIDLGVYLSKIASSVMEAHAIQGIRLELRVDAWPVSINVAMPTGLVVNELMTNALKHGFVGRDRGTITMSSLVDETGCRIVVADDGVGFAEGVTWPTSGKLGSVIVQSLKQNARAVVDVQSSPNNGTRISIFFARKAAEPASNPV